MAWRGQLWFLDFCLLVGGHLADTQRTGADNWTSGGYLYHLTQMKITTNACVSLETRENMLTAPEKSNILTHVRLMKKKRKKKKNEYKFLKFGGRGLAGRPLWMTIIVTLAKPWLGGEDH